MSIMLRSCALTAAVLAAPAAWAAPSCTLLSAPTLNFGAYSAAGGARDAQGALLFSCVPDPLAGPTVSYSVSLNPGSGTTFHPRQLTAGGYSLAYNLYADAARTLVWGDGTTSTSIVTGACAATCSVEVYGRIPGGQGVPAAEYRDDVVVTLNF